MHTVTLRQVGGSVMLSLPKPFLEQFALKAKSSVGVSIDNGRIIVEPNVKPKYTLDELLAQCDPAAPFSEETLDWANDGAAGDEVI
ncbi:antitoxin [Thalassospira profundimaris]|uniref:Antitoxin n=1 Tax=Thalassospira profundimaris TaxID=502049 RepID=A0A367XKN5_9PROT|nr:AbrB/MazE/SpoVT family DNA-binding domain-containing protein [Thalassospira profundimaris]RCK54195.1 antitoxin [Thalassospira profundimaris]